MTLETRRRGVGRVFQIALDLLEKHLPAAMLLTLVIVFLIQILFRYFFVPLDWPDELVGFLFLWLVLLGVGYAERRKELICFSMLYDPAPPRVRRWMDVVGQAIVLAALVISYWPSLQYILYMYGRSSWVLPLRMGVVYAPYMIFLTALIVRLAHGLWRDVRTLAHAKDVT